jgi:23S rRNA (cytidine2498-2'-O)-methyltransferase
MKMILAPHDHADIVREELGPHVLDSQERLFLVKDEAHSYWAQNVWTGVQEYRFDSISEAAKHLRAIQRNWWLHSVTAHRRAQLIQEALPPLKPKAIEFLAPVPKAPLGSWTLWDEKKMYYSPACASPFPDGEVHFIENRTDPPSRAYLKLWEWFTTEEKRPQPGEKVLDLGSSPGGWTWVLDQLGCEVLSVDKAPLAPNLKLSKRVKHIEESAFGLDPKSVGPVDWLFSDIICYPERLLGLVNRWRESGMARNFVCTIKFQGPTDMDAVKKFAANDGAQVRHLFANKHELTFSL